MRVLGKCVCLPREYLFGDKDGIRKSMPIACNEELLGVSRSVSRSWIADMVRLVRRYATERMIYSQFARRIMSRVHQSY